MIESFKNWLEEKGLGNMMTDAGRPKFRNRSIYPDKYKSPLGREVPNINSLRAGPGMAKRVEALQVGEEETPKKKRKLGLLPKYQFDVVKSASTKLDPG